MKIIIKVHSSIREGRGPKKGTRIYRAIILDFFICGLGSTEEEALLDAFEKLEGSARGDLYGVIKLGDYDDFTWYIAPATIPVPKKPYHVRVCEEHGVAHLLAALDRPVTVTSIGPREL